MSHFLNSNPVAIIISIAFYQKFKILEERLKGARGTQEGPSLDEFRTKNRRPCFNQSTSPFSLRTASLCNPRGIQQLYVCAKTNYKFKEFFFSMETSTNLRDTTIGYCFITSDASQRRDEETSL